MQVNYRVDCITEYVQPGQVWFTRNNHRVMNSQVSQHLVSTSTLLYNNSFRGTVSENDMDQEIKCVSNATFIEATISLILEG